MDWAAQHVQSFYIIGCMKRFLSVLLWLMNPVAYLGMAGMERDMGATLTGAQNCLEKTKTFTYSSLNFYYAPHTFISHINTAPLPNA